MVLCWLLAYSACIAHDTHMYNHIWHQKIICHGNNGAAVTNGACVNVQIHTFSASTSSFICFTAFVWNISHSLFSLPSPHICIYLLHPLCLKAFFLCPALPLFLFLTIAPKVSLQNTNVLLSPWKQCGQRGRTGTVREFSRHWHSCQNHSPLVHMWMCGTCMLMNLFLSFFVFFFWKSLVLSYVSLKNSPLHTCLRRCAGWAPAAPSHCCQALLSCSWLSSQALHRVSQLRR